ncbi:MAG: hypothetical protein WC242_03785 [Candidatus Paceibacterota bacterium]|jgi:hypothetical protein
MKREDWARASIAVVLGAFFGGWIGIKIAGSITWWSLIVGGLIGGITGFTIFAYRQILKAARTVRHELKEWWRKENVFAERVGIISGIATGLVGIGLCIYLVVWGIQDGSILDSANISLTTVCFVMSFVFAIMVSQIMKNIADDFYRSAYNKGLTPGKYMKRGLLKCLSFVLRLVPMAIIFTLWFIVFRMPVVVGSVLRFVWKRIIWRFLVLSHSQVGLMVGTDAAIGSVTGIVLNNPYIGAGIGLGALLCSYFFGYRRLVVLQPKRVNS